MTIYAPIPRNPPSDGPVHWRWTNQRFWDWIDERIAWLDEEAAKQREREARR